MCYSRVFWVAKIVAKIIRTLMLRRFCNPSCTTYRGTGSVIDIMICDHGVYHDSWSYFVILWPLLQPKVARKVAKRAWFCNFCNSRVTKRYVLWNSSRGHLLTEKRDSTNTWCIGALELRFLFICCMSGWYSEECSLIASFTNNVLLSNVVCMYVKK